MSQQHKRFQPAEPEEEKLTKHSFYLRLLTADATSIDVSQPGVYGCEYIDYCCSDWFCYFYDGDNWGDAWAVVGVNVWEVFRDCWWISADIRLVRICFMI